ncbi:MAG: thiamine phosphate synthase [Elusimicrobia bacterium]|nr:thiamine phosphate synthase [Elusimicrobiota bacterium]MBD3411814.1 thiamine phosphate synthase [Elusimicrobiota bacterium]
MRAWYNQPCVHSSSQYGSNCMMWRKKYMIGKRELYCITCSSPFDLSIDEMVDQACCGGAQIIQFRHKGMVSPDIVETARRLRDICKKHDVLFIINDHPQFARDIDADGVHIGQDDIDCAQARAIIGHEKCIGLSTHTYEQALKAQLLGADYIGFGPVYPTPTKPDYQPIGTKDIDAVVRKISIPVFAIGGINRDTVAEVIAAGADRVAVVRDVFASDDISGACRLLREKIVDAKKEKIFREV